MKRWIFPSLLATVIITRVAAIWRAPLWYDENFTYLLARLPFRRMLEATAGDTHPPFWYAIVWIQYHMFGDLPAWCIRIPALLFGILAFLLFWRILGEAGASDRVRNAAALIFALAPIQIWFAQEGRMYTLLELEMLVGFWAVLQFRRWPWLAGSMTAMLYTQNYGLFYCATLLVGWIAVNWHYLGICLIQPNKIKAVLWQGRWPLLAFGIALIAWLPWALVIINIQLPGLTGGYWIQPTTPGYILSTTFLLLFTNITIPGVEIAAYFVMFLWLFGSLYVAFRNRRPLVTAVILAAFLPLVLASIISLAMTPVLLFRPLIASSPFLYWVLAIPADLL
jgi:uncharacterized membrane protein